MEAPASREERMFSYVCMSCGRDLVRPIQACPHCGGHRFQAGFRPPFSISGTSIDVRFPLLSDDPHKAMIATAGGTELDYRDPGLRYRFNDIQAGLKTGTHWVKVRTKENPRDGRYLDILFGRRSGGPKDHIGFVIEARTLFVAKDRIGSEVRGTHLFDSRVKAVRPVTRTLVDKESLTAVTLRFGLDVATETIHLTGIQFCKVAAETAKQ